MKSAIYSLENLKRMTDFPYPLKEVGLMINHANFSDWETDSLFFCFSFNIEKYNTSETNSTPHFGIILPGTLLVRRKPVYHDELFFRYTPEIAKPLVKMLGPLSAIRRHKFIPDAEFNTNLGTVRELVENRMVLGNADKLDILALQILFSMITETAENSEHNTSMVIHKAAALLRKGVPLESVLSDCCMSRRSFYYEWKKVFSVSPKQMQIEHKLKEVQRLLLSSSLSVSEITEQCGFSSMTALHDCFVKHCRMTPGEFRKHWQH